MAVNLGTGQKERKRGKWNVRLSGLGLASFFIVSACSHEHLGSDLPASPKNVVSPGSDVARTLVSSVAVGGDLELLLKNFGYIPGSNCFQHLVNQKRDGTTFETVELHSGPCRPFPSQDVPRAQFRLRADTSGTSSSFTHWLSVMSLAGRAINDPRPVGRVSLRLPNHTIPNASLHDLCSLHFANVCDLHVDAAGRITSLTLK